MNFGAGRVGGSQSVILSAVDLSDFECVRSFVRFFVCSFVESSFVRLFVRSFVLEVCVRAFTDKEEHNKTDDE